MSNALPARVTGYLLLRLLAACLLASLSGIAWSANAAETASAADVENRIKAAFLYHFCNYIQWPDSAFAQPDSPLVLGVAGTESVAAEIRSAVGSRTAHGRPILVRRLDDGDTLDGVHLLFIGKSAGPQAQRLVSRARDAAVLVVTDSPAGLNAGGMINFVIQDDKVRFDIDPEAAKQRDLRISAQLLTVARVIHKSAD